MTAHYGARGQAPGQQLAHSADQLGANNVRASQGTPSKGLAWVDACVKDGHNDPSAVILRVLLQSGVVTVSHADWAEAGVPDDICGLYDHELTLRKRSTPASSCRHNA